MARGLEWWQAIKSSRLLVPFQQKKKKIGKQSKSLPYIAVQHKSDKRLWAAQQEIEIKRAISILFFYRTQRRELTIFVRQAWTLPFDVVANESASQPARADEFNSFFPSFFLPIILFLFALSLFRSIFSHVLFLVIWFDFSRFYWLISALGAGRWGIGNWCRTTYNNRPSGPYSIKRT